MIRNIMNNECMSKKMHRSKILSKAEIQNSQLIVYIKKKTSVPQDYMTSMINSGSKLLKR